MPLYRHNPLGNSEIRLLTIRERPCKTDDIAISLITFEQPEAPEYECLSYAWGSEDGRKEVKIQGSAPRSLFVTQNLDEAIRHLRYVDRSRIMWIDAICIDQSNLEERSQQVSKVDQVFKNALRVVFWLGPEENQSSLGMQALDWLGSRIVINNKGDPAALNPFEDERYGLSDRD
ncbi:hypothetical protein PG994_006699 [Apiospora phragmitis]|uniref:Heterokaryon incompatibility domain-containing protein n=1 Tax=Apiospora phragmitis TaxID=2905665 RepID=A0ABR1VJP6_9PEZI